MTQYVIFWTTFDKVLRLLKFFWGVGVGEVGCIVGKFVQNHSEQLLRQNSLASHYLTLSSRTCMVMMPSVLSPIENSNPGFCFFLLDKIYFWGGGGGGGIYYHTLSKAKTVCQAAQSMSTQF